MNFDFTEDQHEIKRTARDLLTKRSGFEQIREAAEAEAYDESLFSELCELGWAGIAVDEQYGGAGLGVVELMILSEELGFSLAASPFLANAIGGLMIEHAGSDEQRAKWLPGIATGEATATLAVASGGVADLAPDADGAAVIVLVDGDSAVLVARDQAEVEPLTTIDPTRRYARVTASGGEPLPGDVAGGLARAEVALSAEMVGIAQRTMEMAIEYAKDRKQFDTPIGAFQAVSHRCAQMLFDTESARSATYFAGWAADADELQLALAASIAKAAASDAAHSVTNSSIQIHGGIGFTWEADVHWFFKRAQLDASMLASASSYRARVTALTAASLAVAGGA